jgi:copper(I)-binding protein
MMLMQATKPLRPADRVPITLRFADGSTVLVQFEVRNPDSSPAR